MNSSSLKNVRPLAAETILSLPPQDRDRANFQRWPVDAGIPAAIEEPQEPPKESSPACDRPPLSLPAVRADHLIRIIRLFDIVYDLCTKPSNTQGGAYARNIKYGEWLPTHRKRRKPVTEEDLAGYSDKRKEQLLAAQAHGHAHETTVRRDLALLERHGWIERIGNTRDRLIRCLVTPSDLLGILGGFARYLRGVLLGKDGSYIVSEHSEDNKNRNKGRRPRVAKPPLPADQELVVVQAANAGMVRRDAEAVVREKGVEPIREALEVLEYQQQQARKRGKQVIQETGAYLAGLVKRAIDGSLKLPGAIIEQRNQAERKAERDRAAENRTVKAATRPLSRPSQVCDARDGSEASQAVNGTDTAPVTKPSAESEIPADVARLLALPGERLVALRKAAISNLVASGRATLKAVQGVSWRSNAGAPVRAEIVRLLDSEEALA